MIALNYQIEQINTTFSRQKCLQNSEWTTTE